MRSDLEKPQQARGAGAPCVTGPPKYGILKFVMGSFGHDFVILTEGSIYRDLRAIGLIIRGAPIYRGESRSCTPLAYVAFLDP